MVQQKLLHLKILVTLPVAQIGVQHKARIVDERLYFNISLQKPGPLKTVGFTLIVAAVVIGVVDNKGLYIELQCGTANRQLLQRNNRTVPVQPLPGPPVNAYLSFTSVQKQVQYGVLSGMAVWNSQAGIEKCRDIRSAPKLSEGNFAPVFINVLVVFRPVIHSLPDLPGCNINRFIIYKGFQSLDVTLDPVVG